ncbi:glycosyltransferase [Blastococcus sp. SYSU D00695]
MRIVQAANFVSPTSGGLRTAMRALAAGYAAHGHEVVQVLPGPEDAEVVTPWGRQVVLRAPALAVAPGYRLLLDLRRVRRVLDAAAPDVLEVHDRTTLRGLGRWARGRGVPAVVVSHERLDRWLAQWTRLPLRAAADRSNAALARDFGTVVCTTEWAAEEFRRIGTRDLAVVPLGVDTAAFPARTGPRPGAPDGAVHLVMASRLSVEKRPAVAVAALRELRRRGVPARLVVAGEGPLRRSLQVATRGLPVQWLGFVPDRARLAAALADADVALAPGPVETFGLAALEALACGTPVVADAGSALPAVLGPGAGRAARGTGAAVADAVEDLLAVPEGVRRRAARSRAEEYSWDATVRGFLAVHAAVPGRAA